MKILFKFCSRSRPYKFFAALDSLVNNLSNKNDYHVLCSFDFDDVTMNDGAVTGRLKTYKNVSYHFGDSKNKIQAINADLDKAPEFDILVNFSDDQRFLIQGFDDIIRKDMSEACNDLDMFLHYPDSHAKDRLPTMSVIGSTYFNRTGYIYHPTYVNVYSDNEAMDVAKILGKHKFINKNIYDHYHPAWGTEQMDDLYRISENPISYAIDRDNYEKRKAANFYL